MLTNLFPLNIFPEGSLANSIIVTVWIGVMVIAFFNLRFGWVLSGLIVPGYLIPLLLIKPVSVLIILFEAWVTYGISVFICNKSGSWLGLSHFFGRDRFFLLVLISVFIRLTFDAFLFPFATVYVQQQWDLQFTFQNDLHSFGLIIISLIANQMWKTGFLRGNWHLFVTLGISFLIVNYLVIGLTNFSIANLSFMYEEIAVAILASPKSYIVLLLCCYLASRMNLLYGWEFSGILIPSLIALQWFFPQKILVTFIETFVILGLGSLLLRIPRVASMDIAGGRKLVVFFTIGFLYKIALAYFIEWYNPYFKVSDYFAFGYLLSTLLAIKIHDKKLLFHTTRATVQTSLVAVVFATAIGFGLTKVNFASFTPEQAGVEVTPIESSETTLEDWLLNKKIEFFESKSEDYIRQATVTEIDIFARAIQLINDDISREKPPSNQAQLLLSKIDFKIIDLDSHILLYSEKHKAWGVYAFNKRNTAYPTLISTPRGLDENLAYDSAFSLYKLLNAKYLAISTSPFKTNDDGSSDNLINPMTFFSYFQKVLSNNNVLQIRTTKRDVEQVAKRYSHLVTKNADSYLWINGNLRKGFDLKSLVEFTQQPEIIWAKPDFFNQQRSATKTGFLELLIDQGIANRLKVIGSSRQQLVERLDTELSIEGYLNDLVFKEKDFIAAKFSNAYVEPKDYESLFFNEEVLKPLLELSEESYINGKWTEDAADKLKNLNELTQLFNYKLSQYRYIRNQKEYLILSENPSPEKRFWGTYIFGLGETSKQIVEIPRPLMELGTFEYGLYLFTKLNAKALLIAGSHPNANQDGTSDVLSRFNKNNLFNIVHYSIFNHYRNSLFQSNLIRGMGYEEAVNQAEVDIILSENNNMDSRARIDRSVKSMSELFKSLNLNYQVLDETDSQTRIGTSSNSLINQLRYQSNKQIISHWISPRLNDKLKQNQDLWLNNKHFQAVGLNNNYVDVMLYFQQHDYADSTLNNSVLSNLDNFIESDNIVYLLSVLEETDYQIELLSDIDSKQTFLVFLSDNDIVAIRNLNGINKARKILSTNTNDSIVEFLDDRHHWMLSKVLP